MKAVRTRDSQVCIQFFFFQAEDGIRDVAVTGVQTCALPISEIGLMKAGEQLSAMEMMAVDPVRRILAPRFVAGLIAMPLLAAVFSAVGVIGGWLVGVVMIGVDGGAFWGQMQNGVDWWYDLGNGVLKSLVFGVAVTFIALLQGYAAKPTP